MTVGGTPAQFVVNSDTQITLTTPNSGKGTQSVQVTNASGSASTNITVSSYTVPVRAGVVSITGTLRTDGIGPLNLQDQYRRFDAVFNTDTAWGKYADYLQKTAKIAAVVLYNQRYSPDISVPTYGNV